MKKVALITGASAGIGKELAFIHAKEGGDLVLVARRIDKLEEIKKEIEDKFKTKVLVISKDLTNPSSPKELYDEVKNQNIEIEYLINNAGFGGQGFFHERKWEEDKNMIQLNITTLTELTRYFLDDFIKKDSGKILNVGSTASFMPGPLQAVYYATKSYVKFFSNALSQELSHTNITVTNLMPGATSTEFSKSAGLDKTKLFENAVSAELVANDGYKGMINGKMDVVSGLPIPQKILMKLLPFIPKKTVLKLIFNLQKNK